MADILAIDTDDFSDKSMVSSFISAHKSFNVVGVKGMDSVVRKLEAAIEKQGMRSRVYTAYRRTAIAGLAIPTFLTQLIGLGTAIFMAAHNVVTFNPDYEIVINIPMGRVEVVYKK